MRIAVSGSSGLVGSALVAALAGAGHAVAPIRRGGAGGIAWDGREAFDAGAIRACDAVVHLAGAGIADGRWTAARRREIRDSRVIGTAALARLLAADRGRVRTLVAASAIGWYGDRGEQEVDEDAPGPGTGFLAEVCRDWEAACDVCRGAVRTAHLRLGVVLSERGGALARMLPPARLGLSGRLGRGSQWWSWIHLDDAVGAIRLVLDRPDLTGPINAVAPAPVRQVEMARALAEAVRRRAWGPPLPAALLRLLLGGMAEATLLASQRVRPARLAAAGFAWTAPDVATALARACSPR